MRKIRNGGMISYAISDTNYDSFILRYGISDVRSSLVFSVISVII